MNTPAARLKHARLTRGWSQQHLAVAAGLSQSAIGNIESGLREGSGSLPKLAKALGISHDWLAYGEGEMFASGQANADGKLEKQQLNLISLPLKRSITLSGRIKMLDAKGLYEEQEMLQSEHGSVTFHSEDPDAYAIRIRGDQIHPAYRNGEILVIEPNVKPEPGDHVLVHFRDGRRYLRELIMLNADGYVLESVTGGDRMTVEASELHRERGLQQVGGTVAPRRFKPAINDDGNASATQNEPPPPPNTFLK